MGKEKIRRQFRLMCRVSLE